ncbi:MAG: MFS transporter [Terriglobia bacterium]
MVAAAFLASFVVFGVSYSFGVFFKPMAAELHASRAATSALFSIAGFASYMLASITGHLSDRFGPPLVVGAGAIMMGAGMVLTAFIGHMWIGYLTYGVGVGVGAACAYVPTLAMVGGWFTKRRNIALGIAAAGTGCGTLLTPPIAAALIERHDWRAT